MTPAMAGWDEQLQAFGSVVFTQKVGRMLLVFGAIVLSVIAGVALGIADDEEIDPQVLGIVAGILAVLVGGPMIYYLFWFRHKRVVVETDGVRLTNGYLMPWSGIDYAGVWSYRGNTSVTLELEEDTMRAYQAQQSRAARMVTKANARLTGSRAVFLPSTLAADPAELATWLNIEIEQRTRRGPARGDVEWFQWR